MSGLLILNILSRGGGYVVEIDIYLDDDTMKYLNYISVINNISIQELIYNLIQDELFSNHKMIAE